MTKAPLVNPLSAVLLLARAKELASRQEFEPALADLTEALRHNPALGDAWMMRAALRAQTRDYRGALDDVERRLALAPPEPLALLTRGNLRAMLLELDSALADFNEFLRQQPGNPHALRARALTNLRLDRFAESLADLDEALRIDSTHADTWVERGRVRQMQGDYPAALADFEKALALAPNEARVCNQFAWMLAACPAADYRDGPRARALAIRANELTEWNDGNLLDTLACAHAECGQFDQAVHWAEKSLARAEGEVKEGISGHIDLFRAGKAVRFEEKGRPGTA